MTNFQYHFHLLADDPVRDPFRAEHLAELCLARKTDADADTYPERFLMHMALGDAALGQGDFEKAARRYEACGGRRARELTGAVRRGELTREHMGDHFVANHRSTEFLNVLCEHESRGYDRDWPEHAAELARLGVAEAGRGRPEHAAVACIRGARIFRRHGRAKEARATLETVAPERIEAIDTRSLLERAFAHELLEDEPRDAARALRLAVHAATPPADASDPRTSCEVADAWALVARARLALGDAPGAKDAVAAGRALAPRDRRALDAVEASLGRR